MRLLDLSNHLLQLFYGGDDTVASPRLRCLPWGLPPVGDASSDARATSILPCGGESLYEEQKIKGHNPTQDRVRRPQPLVYKGSVHWAAVRGQRQSSCSRDDG